ncbi:MAG: D-aminoacyl-tRNA deacylase [Methanobacteriota archaeon]
MARALIAIVVSREDPASVTIGDALSRLSDWRKTHRFEGRPVAESGPFVRFDVAGLHLHEDDLDRRLAKETGLRPDTFVFASKHKAESGTPTLTVHPIGNFRDAAFGGQPGRIVPCDARLQSALLLGLVGAGRRLGFEATFEATHHGPFLSTPSCFLEVGSTENEWRRVDAAEAVAEVLLRNEERGTGDEEGDALRRPSSLVPDTPSPVPVVFGIGGGHYAPRHADLVRNGKAAVGHLLPSYHLQTPLAPEVIREAVAATPGATHYHLDARAKTAPVAAAVEVLGSCGLRRL